MGSVVSAQQLVALQVIEFAALAVAGYLAGRLVHFLLAKLEKMLSGGEKETFSSRIIAEIQGPLSAIFVVIVVFVLSGHTMELSELHSLMAQYYLAIIIALAAYLLAKLVESVVYWRHAKEREQTGKASLSLLPLAGKIVAIAIVFFGITFSLAATGFDVTSFIALSGVAAIVIGFAAQETLGNIIAGIALQLEGQFAQGEYLRLSDGTIGRLRTIGWRSAELDDQDGDTIVLPNSQLAAQQVCNLSRPKNDYRAKVIVRLPEQVKLEEYKQFISQELSASVASSMGVKPDEIEVQGRETYRTTYSVEVSFWLADCFSEDAVKDFVIQKTVEFRRARKKANDAPTPKNAPAGARKRVSF